jgi:hypothetical protein
MRQGISNHLFTTFPSQFAEHVDQSILTSVWTRSGCWTVPLVEVFDDG